MKTDSNPKTAESILLHVHPDSLMCEPYEVEELDASAFHPLEGPWSVEEAGSAGCWSAACGGALQVRALGSDMLRLRTQPGGTDFGPTTTEQLELIHLAAFEPAELHVAEEDERIQAEGAGWSVSLHRETGNIAVEADGVPVLESLQGGAHFSSEPPEYGGHRFLASFKLALGEKIWGFGGRVQSLNRCGSTIDVFSEKVGTLRGDYGGFPIPFFISSRGYGIFLNNPWPHVYFDMGKTQSDRWFVTAPGGEFDLFVVKGSDVPSIVERFTRLVGRVAPPQKFLFGYWVSSLTFETSSQLLEIAERLRKEDWPCDALVLDGPWRGGPEFIPHYEMFHEYMNNDLEWHPDFGDGASMMRTLHDQGFKVSLHLNSRIFLRETAEAALAKGLLRRHGEEVVVKLEDPAGEKFFLDHLQPRIDEGADLWWTDHTDRVSGEIKPGVPSRNLFGPLWNRFLARAMADSGMGERLSLSRGGGIGSQRYALPWPGDTATGIDRFAEDIWFCLAAGISGFPITSVDMGGFTAPSQDMAEEEVLQSVFGKENLHRRLFQSLMLVPSPRIHNNYTEVPRLPWNCPEESQELYRAFLKERYKLAAYFYSLGLEAAATGAPILRPLFYHYQEDPATHDISDVFMVGDRLLAAPVFDPGVECRRFYLPAGTWFDYWTGERLEGGREVDRPCPIDHLEGLPLLVRAGAILPLQEPVSYLADEPPGSLSLVYYCDEDGMAELTLREGPDLVHRFSVARDATGDLVAKLENQTDRCREYLLRGGDGQSASAAGGGEVRCPVDARSEAAQRL